MLDYPLRFQFIERIGDGVLQQTRSRSTKFDIYHFESPNEVNDFASRVRPAGGRAEMGAAAERTGFVDETVAAGGIEQGTGARGILGQLRAASRAERFGC